MTEHEPYIHTYREPGNLVHMATCPCGWAGIEWLDLKNAEHDVERHRRRFEDATDGDQDARGT